MRKPKFYYFEKDICYQTSLLCKSRREFYIKYNAAYKAAKINGWLDDFLPSLIKEKDYWTYDRCKEESLKYLTKKSFKENSETAYKKILKNKWDNDLLKHMKVLGNFKKRLIYAQEFPDNSVYIGLTYNIKKRSKNHLKIKKETVFKYMEISNLEPTLKILTDFLPLEEAILKEKEYVELYKKNKWNVLNVSKTGGIGRQTTKWNIDVIMSEAKKYNSKSEFKRNSYNAYCAMYKYKCQDMVCSHMINNQKEVYQFMLNGDFIGKYSSINDAHKKTGVRYSTIYNCLNEKYKTGCGFVWKSK